jgi:molecular chaperone DnaK (HSP70)
MKTSRYLVSLDLGTTNCALSWVRTDEALLGKSLDIRFFEIPQVVAEGESAPRILMPSYLYLPGPHDLRPESVALPWDRTRPWVVGEFARVQGARVPARLVSSAKSWLCHPGVDRSAPILPWGAPEEVAKVSPVEASARYVSHLREAWNHVMAKDSLEDRLELQEVIITIPASFNEVARELTIEAAHRAGLERVALLEEPQAAFYAYIAAREKTWFDDLGGTGLILVVDVGGGTTDFTLIKVEDGPSGPQPRRVAVGEHLMLGGDNMDLALARRVEERLSRTAGKLDARQWGTLLIECQRAKEHLLEEEEAENVTITLPGSGSRLIGGLLQDSMTRREALDTIEDGFFPDVSLHEAPTRTRRGGLAEWGLPYAQDPAITRHLAAFVRESLGGDLSALPGAVLFNGGALRSPSLQRRLTQVIESWYSEEHAPSVRILPTVSLDLAVSMGGAYFGLVRMGRGVRIGGGSARSFYVGVGQEEKHEGMALCVVPKHLEEGQEREIKDRKFSMLLGRPVSFPLFSSKVRPGDEAGALVRVDENDFESLPPLVTLLEMEGHGGGEIPVHLKARLTEIGTLEVWCLHHDLGKRWRLSFQLRGGPYGGPSDVSFLERETVLKARSLTAATFSRRPAKVQPSDVRPRGLMSAIESMVKMRRDSWPVVLIRDLWDGLHEVRDRRRSDPDWEAPWLNMAGFALRPGFGYPLDDWRIDRMWEIFPKWLQFNRDSQSRMEWWVMWRRIASGLCEDRQSEIFTMISPHLVPGRKHWKTFPGPHPSSKELVEIQRLAASLEGLPGEDKTILGRSALNALEKGAGRQHHFWLLARYAGRIPFSPMVHKVLPPDVAAEWVEWILSMGNPGEAGAFALMRICRLTGDRHRDLPGDVRERAAQALKGWGFTEKWTRPILEIREKEKEEDSFVFGEALPLGLRLRADERFG